MMLGQPTLDVAASAGPYVSTKIAQLNDQLRRGQGDGRVMLTPGVAAMPPAGQIELLKAVQRFDDFADGNDPYGEHDFGAVHLDTETFFWKIDCYDVSMTMASPDPTDPSVTCRVLTIMRADEY